MAERLSIKDAAKGRWPGILTACGVDKNFLVNRHGPCPMCGGKDRFRFDDKGIGSWFCNQCGAGNGVDLVMKANGWDFKTAASEIEKNISGSPVVPIRDGPDPRVIKAECRRILAASKPLADCPPAAAYLMRRVCFIPTVNDLRGVDLLKYPNHGEHPALVAVVRGVDGKVVNLHRTYLAPNGKAKAPLNEPRRVMPLPLPDGCAIRLGEHTDTLGIAEGIETALAASLMFKVPVWASITAGCMERWEPPAGVKNIAIFGDNDESYTGQAAAYGLAKRLKRVEGRSVVVKIPDQRGDDWCDVRARKLESK